MKENHFLLQTLDRTLDFALNFFSAYFAYFCVKIWYHPWFDLPDTEVILNISIICLLALFLYSYYNVYRPMRTQGKAYFLSRIFFANLLVAGICTALVLILHKEVYS